MDHPTFHAQTTPDKPAYVIAETGETLSFAELDRRSNRGAQLFVRIGLKPGDHVALLMENGLAFVEICWAAQRAGLIYTPISRYLKADEIAYIVRDCEAKAFVTSPASAGETNKLAGAPGAPLMFMTGVAAAGIPLLGRGSRRDAGDAGRECIRRSRHALLLGHDGAAQGRRNGADADAARRPQPDAEAALRRHVRRRPGERLSVAGASLPRRAAALHDDGGGARRDGRADAKLRRRALSGLRPAISGDAKPARADDVRAAAEAAEGGARPIRRHLRSRAPSTPPRPVRSTSNSR